MFLQFEGKIDIMKVQEIFFMPIMCYQYCDKRVYGMNSFFAKQRKGDVVFVVTAVIVANNFIYRAIEEHCKDLTPLKLQKLIYFLFKEYLQRTGTELFSERFETWKYGPVLPSVYYEFSSFGRRPITKFARESQNTVSVVAEEGVFKEAFDFVWEEYKDFTGEELSNKTHTVDGAWWKAYDSSSPYLKTEDIRNEKRL